MNHPTEDSLLQYLLDTLTESGKDEIVDHLAACDACRQRLATIEKSVDAISGIRLEVETPYIPLPQARKISLLPLLKAAAILLIGFIGGLVAADLLRPDAVTVVEQRFVPQAVSAAAAQYVACENESIGTAEMFRLDVTN